MAKKKVEEPHVEQPTEAQQREYKSMVEDIPTSVGILRTGKKYRIKWIKNGAVERLSKLLVHAKEADNDASEEGSNIYEAICDDARLSCKAAALFILNGYWSIKFKYWFLWRWFYYVRQYDGIQLQPLLAVGKKKLPLMQFYGTTTLLTGVKDTLMQMRIQEVERILQEQALAQYTSNVGTGSTSSGQDTSSSGS